MKLLILCDMFPPAFAPRMGYLCKYLKRAGWEVSVVTEYIEDQTFAFLTGYAEVTCVDFYPAKNKLLKKLKWLGVFLLDFCFGYKDKVMKRKAAGLLDRGGYCGVLCSTYRTFPLPAAAELAKAYKLPFVADLRDIVEQYAGDEFIAHSFQTFPWLDRLIVHTFRRKLLAGRNKALRAANYATTVSPWHVEQLKIYNPNVKLIYNGYDPEIFFPANIQTEQFVISYTGRLISLKTRDPKPLFEAIRQLDNEQQIHPSSFRLRWYMDNASKELIEPLADSYGIAPYMDYLGYVPADQIPHILNSSSVLLQLANKADAEGPKGYMTTKLFEAFAVEKPLLMVRSDESYMEETINKAQAGLAARSTEEIITFIQKYYAEWKEKGYTTIAIDRKVANQFSREKQAVQFMDLLNPTKNHNG